MANPLKVLTALSASSGAAISGSDGLKIQQGGLTIGVGAGTAAVQALTATTISGSSTLQVGGISTFAGALNAQSGVTVTGAALNASAVEVSASALNVAGAASVGGNLTVTGDLQVQGSLNAVNRTDLYVTDKVILVASGSANAAAANGAGLSVSIAGVADPSFTWDQTGKWVSTEDLDLASGKVFKINGTTVLDGTSLGSAITGATGLTSLGTITSLTASALNVTGLAKLDGNVNLGNQSSDIITVAGQLTASEGIAIASGKKVSLNGIQGLESGSVTHPQLGASSAVIVSYNGVGRGSYLSVASSSGGPVEGTFVDISSSLQTIVRGTGIEGMVGGVTLIGGAGGVEVTGEGAGINDINISSANGGIKLNAAGSSYGIYISSPSNTTGTLVDGALNIKSSESYSYITKRTDLGFDTINISGALKQLDAAISGMNGASVSPTEYYNVRTVVSGTKQAGNSSIVFTLSGSVQGQNGRTPNGSTITGLSASTAASLIQKLGGMSFDVAVRDMTSALWANDLVSVQLSASAVSNGFYWPIVTVDAPAATDGAEIRLIAVNETANIIT